MNFNKEKEGRFSNIREIKLKREIQTKDAIISVPSHNRHHDGFHMETRWEDTYKRNDLHGSTLGGYVVVL